MKDIWLDDQKISKYLSFLLRHHPEEAGLEMDVHGWVAVEALLKNLPFSLTMEHLERIVAEDEKGRYRLSGDKSRIRACQGHSIPWVEPELTYGPPPETLYHGTTAEAWELIRKAGYISKMARHAVHLQANPEKAWASARRWKKTPVVLVVDAGRLHRDGGRFGVSDNGVWCVEKVNIDYVSGVLDR